jgi:hypothetical protein
MHAQSMAFFAVVVFIRNAFDTLIFALMFSINIILLPPTSINQA